MGRQSHVRCHVLGQWGPSHTVAKIKAPGLKLGLDPSVKPHVWGCPRTVPGPGVFAVLSALKARLSLVRRPAPPNFSLSWTVGPCADVW